jgi:hypothetical protein
MQLLKSEVTMIALSRNEIIYQLERLGIDTGSEHAIFLREYVEYFSDTRNHISGSSEGVFKKARQY